MSLLDLLFPKVDGRHLAALAAEIARRIKGLVWERVAGKILGMSLAESRGYVQAWSAGYVEAEVARAVAFDRRMTAETRARLNAHATRLVIELVQNRAGAIRSEPAARSRAA
jgi:hypothetical protein